MPIPQNAEQIYKYLTGHGYSGKAAAGIAGNMEQESGGNPESVGSGGGGLIGFTPLPSGYVTGHPAKDLATQLSALLAYNRNQSNASLSTLNSEGSPSAAAIYYMNEYERPAKATENEANRVDSAVATYNAAQSGNWGNGGGLGATTDVGGSGNLGSSIVSGILGSMFGGMSMTDLIERGFLILMGLVLILIGVIKISGNPGNPAKEVQGARRETAETASSESNETVDTETAGAKRMREKHEGKQFDEVMSRKSDSAKGPAVREAGDAPKLPVKTVGKELIEHPAPF
jgi:Phage tail lysozyme